MGNNPYDPNSTDDSPEVLPLDVLMKDAINAALLNVHTWLPAKVVKIKGNQRADIQPLLQRQYITGDVVDLPVIQDALVHMPMGKNWYVKLPFDVGDDGIALFCERSLDKWSVNGGLVNPEDSRHHTLSDVVFIPGLVPFSGQTTDATTDMIFKNGDAVFKMKRSGKFQIKNNSNELIDVLDQITHEVKDLANTLSNDTVNTIFGPVPLNSFVIYANIEINLALLITKLESLKG